MNKIKTAVIGVGYLGKFHADKYQRIPHVDLVGVCDTDKSRCDEVAKACNTTAFYDYHELLDKVDAVSIATPTHLHHPISKACLDHKIHVLLEKPITNTVAEANDLIATAKTNGVILQIGHLERFNPAVIALEGVLHQPLFIESRRMASFQLRGTEVNVILDLMIHDIDIIQAIVNSPISTIDAIGAPVLSASNDLANARIHFENGCVANVNASRVSLRKERKMQIFQPDSFISMDLQNKYMAVYRKGTNEMLPGIPEIVSQRKLYDKSDPLYEEIVSFLNAVQSGTAPVVSGEDGKNALATAIEITRAIKRHAQNIDRFPITHDNTADE